MKDTFTSQERSALFVVTLSSFMQPFMISSVNVALPTIQKDLHINAVELSWIATSYLLAVAVGLLPSGKVADIIGRKKVFTTGVVVYTVGSLLAAFSNSFVIFIILRVLQGLGAGLYTSTGMAILTSIFPPQKRGRAIGISVAGVYIGLSMGPFLGGIITQHLGWRTIFLLMLPLGAISLLLIFRFLKEEWKNEQEQGLDLIGCLLYALPITLLVYGASRLPETVGVVLVVLALAGILVFLLQQHRSRFPILELSLFRNNKVFAFSSFAALLHYSATFGVTLLMSLYLQYIKGFTPQTAGVILISQPVMMAVFSVLAGRLADRVEPRFIASTGMVMTVIGVFILSLLTPATPLALIIADLVFLGIGFAFFTSPNMTAMMGAVEKRHYGLASGLVSTMRLLGQMTSMAIVTVALAMLVGREAIVPANYGQFLLCLQVVFLISSGLCLVGVFFSWYRGSVH